ncbi:uncharacterized protein LOC135135304 [Zophobas morio]|uniref:uncharacterized protein LOC135135304 n=1 Tax=Zophobas morio TaxID=2755281 RepID=UPI00308322F3
MSQENDDFDAPPSPIFLGRMGLIIEIREANGRRRQKRVLEEAYREMLTRQFEENRKRQDGCWSNYLLEAEARERQLQAGEEIQQRTSPEEPMPSTSGLGNSSLAGVRSEAVFDMDDDDDDDDAINASFVTSDGVMQASGAGIEQDEEETTLAHLEVYEEREKFYPRFGLTSRLLEFRFKPMSDEANPATWLENGMRELLRKVLVDVSPDDWVGMVLTSENFVERPLAISFRKRSQMSFVGISRRHRKT